MCLRLCLQLLFSLGLVGKILEYTLTQNQRQYLYLGQFSASLDSLSLWCRTAATQPMWKHSQMAGVEVDGRFCSYLLKLV